MSHPRLRRLFRKREMAAPLATAIGIVVVAMAASRVDAADLTGNAALTSDYVWRGSTQTHGDPAVQAGFKVASDAGFYASVWGSNVEFAPETHASSELDFVVGWGKSLGDDWAADVNVLHYRYPSTTVDLNWTELNGTLTYKGNYWLSAGYSNEALGYGASGTYTQLGAKFPLNDRFRFEAAAAHYFLDDRVVAENGYSHGQLSAIWAFKAPFEARLTAHATDSNAKRIFGDNFAGSRVEAALQASF
ncbi:MAG TPA: TorF family putative porin [Pseudoxanthomonas sp.]|nr:TorF family putative porin [Pseudoxanthomonas sp.]